LLTTEISKLEFGENHKQACELLEKLSHAYLNYHKIRNNPEEFLSEKFEAMRRKVDLIREQIIQKVHDCSEKNMSDINTYEERCKLNLRDLDSKLKSNRAFELSGIKAKLSDWETRMHKLYYDKDLCTEINDKSEEYSKSLKNSLKDLKNELFLGQEKKLQFETKYCNIFDTFSSTSISICKFTQYLS
jgi:hypothetical protein